MSDDKTRAPEPRQVADEQGDEVRYLTEWYGLSEEQARELIALVGNDCRKLDEAAERLTA
jgi:hypothetical protein